MQGYAEGARLTSSAFTKLSFHNDKELFSKVLSEKDKPVEDVDENKKKKVGNAEKLNITDQDNKKKWRVGEQDWKWNTHMQIDQ